MKRKSEVSPLDREVLKSIKQDPEYAASYFEELARIPLPLQLALLRRLYGVTQEKMAARLHVRQEYVSRLEKPGSDHLLSNYEKAVKSLNGRLAIIPANAKVVPA